MKERSIRNLHYRVGVTIVVFLLVQAVTGSLLALGTLASVSGSKWFQILGLVHTDWDPLGSLYRIFLGLGTAAQCVLGIVIIFLSRGRQKRR